MTAVGVADIAGTQARTLISRLDAATSPLGPPAGWSPALKAAVELILPARAEIVMFWGPQYVALYNDAYAPTIGDKHPGALGRPAVEHWTELWDDLEPLLRGVRETGETFHAKDRRFYIERDGGRGEDVFFDVSYSAVPDVDGSVGGVLCIVSETTTRVRAHQQALADRDRLWALSRDPFTIADAQGVWLNASPAWTEILGWAPEELVGRTSEWMEHPEDVAPTRDEIRRLAQGGGPLRFENRFRGKDGAYRSFSWMATPEGDLLYCVARDVTAERSLEAQLRQSQKMEAVGQLTGGLAHDFNNLLTGISGSLEMLTNRLAQGRTGDIERYIAAARGAASRASTLTHRLLAFSRRQTLDPRPTDINRLVAGMEELVRRTMGPQVELEVVAAGGLWRTLIDPNQLENALLNLCLNARDAMPEGGRLTIETANRWLDERGAAARSLPPGQYVSLCVSDTGAGMTPDVIARAFDPFFTTKPIGVGTGLGLSMTYGFVRQSGGQVRIYSEPGEGAMVCLYLPRHAASDPPDLAADPAPLPQPHAASDRTVLVVDDEPTVRMLVMEVLAERGFGAIEAWDGPSGLRVLESDARIDLLITDVGLPGGMNGRQMADQGRLRRPDLKVLFITGFAENAVIGNGQLKAGMHVLTKPFALEALAARIHGLIEGD